MSPRMTRRSFLQAGAAGGAGLLAALPGLAAPLRAAAQASPGVCLTICNHWSYIGIGWQLGIESCVLSAVDAMEMADREPHVRTCLNLDARAYEFMAETFPETAERLKAYLAAGKIELIGGTYGQPMGTTIGGESNVRQIVLGREVIRKTLGYEMTTFLEEEEFTHPQIPQMAAQAGFRYASLAQLDTWGRAGCPRQDVNVVRWRGLDGTDILSVPKNALFGYAPDLKKLAAAPEFLRLAGMGKPLIFAWEEFGWESPETPAYLTAPARYKALEQVEFVTLKGYLDKYGGQAGEPVELPMDAWDKSLTWGLGGDQVRIMDRKVEALLLAAETFDAAAASLGRPSRAADLEKAWRDLLASQSHDVGLCEYSRWQGDRMAPLDRVEDKHNFTWGALGYNHLDAARRRGEEILAAALDGLAGKGGSPGLAPRRRTALVFNALAWPREGIASTGALRDLPSGTKGIAVLDRAGRPVPSQIVKSAAGPDGSLIMAEAAFKAAAVPSVGFDAYAVEFAAAPAASPASDLRVDEAGLVLENAHLRVRLDPDTGAVAGLEGRDGAGETLGDAAGAFPRFLGRPTRSLSTRPNPPDAYDSFAEPAVVDWQARGPLWATVRARHARPYLKLETRVTLAAGSPYVEVLVRVLAQTPPQADVNPPDIKEGYWLSFAPGFPVRRVLRDYPFGAEETGKPAFHALTWADLIGPDRGLLVLHAGTQYFRRDGSGRFENLVMREWESHFTGEFGWPVYAEYRYGLWPHAGSLSHRDRRRAAAEFARPLDALVTSRGGALPPARGFLSMEGDGLDVTAFRRLPSGGCELRVVETEGRPASGLVTVGPGFKAAIATDLLGNRLSGASLKAGRLEVAAAPWKILTYRLED